MNCPANAFARCAAASSWAASAGDTSKTRPNTSLSATKAAAMPQLVRKKLRRSIPSLRALVSARSLSRSSNCRWRAVCGNGLNSPFDTMRVGTGDRNPNFSAGSVSASSRLLKKIAIPLLPWFRLATADCAERSPSLSNIRKYDTPPGRTRGQGEWLIDPCSSSGGERVQPPQAGKSAKITIGGAKGYSVLYCERCHMGVRHQISVHSGQCDQSAQRLRMMLGRLGDPSRITSEPRHHLPPGVGDWLRVLEYAWICYDTKECEQTRPWQSDTRNIVELLIEPIAGSLVLGERIDMGIDQEVGIDKDQAKSSPSVIARTSAILSMLVIRARPRSTDRVRIGERGFGRPPISCNPRRSASLMRLFRAAPRFLRSCSSIAATSSSIVSVVRTHQDIK